MKTAIVIHGMPSKTQWETPGYKIASRHWFPWIKSKLEEKGFEVFLPEMPEPYAPDYDKWAAEFEKLPLQEDTVLVGHSAGAGFLVRWLSENKFRVGKVALVAPWLDPSHSLPSRMFEFEIDNSLVERTAGVTAFISSDDEADIQISLELLKSKLQGLEVKQFTDKGHFTIGDMKTEEFPELLEVII
jgi:predicted alpha/beta hydrolase family esterase